MRRDLWVLDAREQADAAEQYRRACAGIFAVELLGADATFSNRMDSFHIEAAIFSRCEGVAQRFDRSPAHLVADGGDNVQVVLDLPGNRWEGDYDGRLVDSRMGVLRVIDWSRPFQFRADAFRTLNLMLPRALLGPAAGFDLHGLVAPETSPSARLLAGFMHALWENLPHLTAAEARPMATAASALVQALIFAQAGVAWEDARPADKVSMVRARSLIDARLGDPDLTPESVAAELGVSRAKLYRLFKPLGGVSAFVQVRRLDHAFRTIMEDKAGAVSLSEVGYRHGFRSDANFNRAFRRRFGAPPGRLRNAAEGGELLNDCRRPDLIWDWLRDL